MYNHFAFWYEDSPFVYIRNKDMAIHLANHKHITLPEALVAI
jgi:hypothetical protein